MPPDRTALCFGDMTGMPTFDRTDADLLLSLIADPRSPTSGLAERVGISRNTAQARLQKWAAAGALRRFDRCISTDYLGYPLRAYVFTLVEQRKLDTVAKDLQRIDEVLAVEGLSGEDDLIIQVVARDADDMYRIAGRILSVSGVVRTRTALVMRDLVDYRVTQLLE